MPHIIYIEREFKKKKEGNLNLIHFRLVKKKKTHSIVVNKFTKSLFKTKLIATC